MTVIIDQTDRSPSLRRTDYKRPIVASAAPRHTLLLSAGLPAPLGAAILLCQPTAQQAGDAIRPHLPPVLHPEQLHADY